MLTNSPSGMIYGIALMEISSFICDVMQILLFVTAVIIGFFFPGRWILRKLSLVTNSKIAPVLSIVIGILFFTLLGYILSGVHLFPIIIFPILLIGYRELKTQNYNLTIKKGNRFIFALIGLSAIFFSLPMLLVGKFGNTLAWRSDDIVHLAYINELIHHFPPENPGFAGIPLLGYHFFYDFLIASFQRVSILPVEMLYFHAFPLLVSFLWAFGVYEFVTAWQKKVSAGLWAVFFTLFGGSFAFILRFQGHKEASLASSFGIDQPATALLNPPFAISIVLIIVALTIIYEYQSTKKYNWLWLLGFVVGMVPMFKIYAGIILFAGFGILVISEILNRKYKVIIPFIGAILITIVTFGIFSGKGNSLIWAPLWAPHKVLSEKLPWYGFTEKQYTYYRLNVIKGIFQIEFDGLVIFILGNLGTRIIGLIIAKIVWLKSRKAPSLIAIIITVLGLVSISIPLFYLQSGKVFEIIQFAWYYPFFVSLFAAGGLGYLSQKNIPRVITVLLILLIVIFTIPSAYENYTGNIIPLLKSGSRVDLSGDKWQIYTFLKTNGNYEDTLLEVPDSLPSVDGVNLWYRKSLPFYAAFGNKRTYLNSQNIDFTNLDIESRMIFTADIIQSQSLLPSESSLSATLSHVKNGLLTNQIKYIVSQTKLTRLEKNNTLKFLKDFGNTQIYLVATD
jgi:hypothetical protein